MAKIDSDRIREFVAEGIEARNELERRIRISQRPYTISDAQQAIAALSERIAKFEAVAGDSDGNNRGGPTGQSQSVVASARTPPASPAAATLDPIDDAALQATWESAMRCLRDLGVDPGVATGEAAEVLSAHGPRLVAATQSKPCETCVCSCGRCMTDDCCGDPACAGTASDGEDDG